MTITIEEDIAIYEARQIEEGRKEAIDKILFRYEDPAILGDFIFRLRKKCGWSRRYVANKLGFNSESSIMNFERGTTIVRPVHIARLCAVLPDNLTVPIFYSMFDCNSLNPPCRCVCHHDQENSVRIYDDDDRCTLCEHKSEDGQFSDSGHWFEFNEKG